MGILENLNVDWHAIPINIVGFLLLLWIARKLVFTPIGNLIAERQLDISSTYDRIDADEKRMTEARTSYEKRLATIEEERRDTVQRAINEAQTTRDQIIHEAQVRAQEMVHRAELDVVHEREIAMVELRNQVVDLAMGATAKVIGVSLDETRQRRLIDEFISAGTATNASPAPAGAG